MTLEERLKMAWSGIALDELADDPDWVVRAAVALQGYALEKLKNDPSPEVRKAVYAYTFGRCF